MLQITFCAGRTEEANMKLTYLITILACFSCSTNKNPVYPLSENNFSAYSSDSDYITIVYSNKSGHAVAVDTFSHNYLIIEKRLNGRAYYSTSKLVIPTLENISIVQPDGVLKWKVYCWDGTRSINLPDIDSIGVTASPHAYDITPLKSKFGISRLESFTGPLEIQPPES